MSRRYARHTAFELPEAAMTRIKDSDVGTRQNDKILGYLPDELQYTLDIESSKWIASANRW